ncbi:ribosomal-processing cysteine protease Prp [Bacillus gobiensis]|uniref:ribosomal-processing cysteine protease Prp n=1 Tax=Bacillus gobiensis TaxID=1441095 RepID=UPI003D193E61
MIQATINRSVNSREIVSFSLSGHADFAEHGQDLVCAGASAVVIGAINAVEAVADIKPVLEMSHDGGYVHFEFPAEYDHSAFQKAQLLLEGMIVSLETIERDYQDYLQLKQNTI